MLEMAKKYNVNMSVRSSLNNNEGTYVKEESKVEKTLVRGVARDNDVASIAVCNLRDEPGIAFRIFSILAKKGINVDIILQSIGRNNTKDISFTVAHDQKDEAIEALQEIAKESCVIVISHRTSSLSNSCDTINVSDSKVKM